MNYPDDVAKLGLEYYHVHLQEIEQLVSDRKDAARMEREVKHAVLEAKMREAERFHQERVKQGKACPKCGFSSSWNGARCGHCRYQVE